MQQLRGRVFYFGDNVDTDQILPGYAMSAPAEDLKNYALKGSSMPDFPEKVKQGDIIIAGENFGCGSSREQAPVALKDVGVAAIVAGSFAMIFRKNSINIGLPVITSGEIENIYREVKSRDEVELNIEKAVLTHISTGRRYKLNPLSTPALETLRDGGLINKVKNKLRGQISR